MVLIHIIIYIIICFQVEIIIRGGVGVHNMPEVVIVM